MKLQSPVSYRILIHAAGWLFFFLLPFTLAYQRELHTNWFDSKLILAIELRNLLLMGFFYLNLLYITPTYLIRRGAAWFVPIIIGSLVVVTVITSTIQRDIAGGPRLIIRHSEGPPSPPMLPPPPAVGRTVMFHSAPLPFAGPNFLLTCIVASVSTVIVMWEKWNQAKQDEQERTLQKVAAELSVLKLQISPHFLFNTLNNIRWLVRSKSEQAEEAVVKLSQLLRYILYQTNQDKVSLIKEVQHLEDFISLQQIRLNNKDRVAYNFRGDFQHHQIVPLLFIPPVENFFKYGDFDSGVTNQISLEVNGDRLIFLSKNKIAPTSSNVDKEASGIGLVNLQKRLALHYPGNHTLSIDHQADYFEILMTINLK